MPAGKSKIGIEGDVAGAAKAGAETAKAFVSPMAKAGQQAGEMFAKLYGKELEGKVSPQAMSAGLFGGLKKEVEASKNKRELKSAAESISKTLGDDISITPAQLQKMMRNVKRDIDTNIARLQDPEEKKQGFFGKMMWGKRGFKGFRQQFRTNMRAISGTISRGALQNVGLQNLPGNIRAMGGSGLAGAGMGLLGGVGLTGAQVGMGFINKSISYGLNSRERAWSRMGPYMGMGANAPYGAFSGVLGAGRRAGYLAEETAGIMAPAFRQGIMPSAAGSILRATRQGIGPELTGMLGGQVMRGDRVGGGQARRAQIEVIATGIATGLERGRWGEVARGMATLITSRGLGITGMGPERLSAGYRAVSAGFRGAEATQAIQGLEGLAQGGRTPVGRALGLMQSGLGGGLGGDIFAAERQMELGMFGKSTRLRREEFEGGHAVEKFSKEGMGLGERGGKAGLWGLLNRYKQMFGFGAGQDVGLEVGEAGSEPEMRRGGLIKTLASNMGLTQNATEKLINAMEQGVDKQDELQAIIEDGAPLEQRAFKSIIKHLPKTMTMANLEATMEDTFSELWPLIGEVIKGINELLAAVREGNSVLGTIANSMAAFLRGDWGSIFGGDGPKEKGYTFKQADAVEKLAEGKLGEKMIKLGKAHPAEFKRLRAFAEFAQAGGDLPGGGLTAEGFRKQAKQLDLSPEQQRRIRQAFTEGGEFKMGKSTLENELKTFLQTQQRMGKLDQDQQTLLQVIVEDPTLEARFSEEEQAKASTAAQGLSIASKRAMLKTVGNRKRR